MKINSFLLFFLLLISNSYSQDYASMFSVGIKNKDVVVFQAINKKSNETTMFLADNKRINAVLLNERLAFKDSLSSKTPDEIYKNIVGYSIADKKTTLFWANEDFSSFFLHSFDFVNRTNENKTFPFDVEKEDIIQFFSENENFYILSYVKSKEQLKFTVFNDKSETNEIFLDVKQLNSYTLNLLVTTKLTGEKDNTLRLEKIATDIPVFFTESLKKNKCYSTENNIVITFDSSFLKTLMIVIDLKTFKVEEKIITKISTIDGMATTYSNSFVLDDRIVQVAGTTKAMSISIKVFNDTLIKEYNSKTNPEIFDAITFYEESVIGSATSIPKKESFFNKMDNKIFGFSCYKTNENIVFSIGKPIPLVDKDSQYSNYAMFGGMLGGAIGSLAGSIIDYAISNNSYRSFENSMANGRMYFNFWMDLDYNTIPMKNRDLAFEKMRKSLKNQKIESGQTIFKVNSTLYFGFYNFKEKRYFIKKFVD